LATATTTSEEPLSPSSPTASTWEDLYIIPSSFSDDDEGGFGHENDAETTAETVRAWPTAGPIVILPGFGNDTQDYESPFGDSRKGLAPRLRRRGFLVETVRLRRRDWLRVAKAIASPAYWRGEADVGPGYRWYLLRVAAAVKRAEEAWVDKYGTSDSAPPPRITLVGHSAGGWLARAFLGDASLRSEGVAEAAQKEEDRALQAMGEATMLGGGIEETLATLREVFFSRSLAVEVAGDEPLPCHEKPHPSVGALVTLGTPHTPPVGKSARDVTGGALAWVNEQWPGAFFGGLGGGGGEGAAGADSGKIVYVTVAGRAVLAPPAQVLVPRGSPPSYAREAYRTVAGDLILAQEESENGGPMTTTTIEGDAVVPLVVASEGLPGADARVVLDGVWHSMSKLGTFKEAPGGGKEQEARSGKGSSGARPWYGSGGALDAWLAALRDVQEAKR
jgi:hypothetical protein